MWHYFYPYDMSHVI